MNTPSAIPWVVATLVIVPPAWTDARIAEAFSCRVQTIENLRKRVVLESFELALDGK